VHLETPQPEAIKMVKQDIDGEMYDYKFDVDVADNMPTIYLGYNIGEDPNAAAERFVSKHKLPVSYFNNVVNHLREHVPELKAEADIGADKEWVRIGGGVVDAKAKEKIKSMEKRPSTNPDGYMNFNAEKVGAKASEKLREMNAQQTEPEKKLTEDQLLALEKITPYTKVTETDAELLTALEVGLRWSKSTIVAYMDILGLALLNPDMNRLLCTKPKGDDVVQRLVWFFVDSEGEMSVGLRTFICRAICNATVHEPGRNMLDGMIKMLLEILIKETDCPKETVKIAAAAAIHNLALMLMDGAKA